MDKTGSQDSPTSDACTSGTMEQRRAVLKKLGRFAAVSAPTVTLLLAASVKPNAVQAASGFSSRALKARMGPINGDAVLAAVKSLRISRS